MLDRKKIKIGFFIPYFLPAWRFGGNIKSTYEVGKRLAKRGHQVFVYCTDLSNNPAERVKIKKTIIEGMNVVYFRNLSNKLASRHKIFLPFKLRNYLSSELEKLDIIHIQAVYTIITFWIYKRLKKINKPFFISTRGTLSAFSQNERKLLKIVLLKFIVKILKSADLIFAQTDMELENCLSYGLYNSKILNNGIDIKEFQNLPSREIFRKKYGISNEDIIILFLGRINPIKGLKYLVEAFSHLVNIVNKKLLIIGPDDNYLKTLLKIISNSNLMENILVLNGLYGQEKIEAYAAADIFCLPSVYDCCPNSMLEACASGLPIITSNNNGLFPIVKSGAGIVVPSCNVEKVKDALLFLIENPDMRKKFGDFGKKLVLKKYDWERITDSLESYYQKILFEKNSNNR